MLCAKKLKPLLFYFSLISLTCYLTLLTASFRKARDGTKAKKSAVMVNNRLSAELNQSSRCIGIERLPAKLKTEDGAFLFETSNSSSLDFRQACAVESLALLNPDMAIYLFKTGSHFNKSSTTVRTLIETYENVNVMEIDLNEFFANTPLQQWYQTNEKQRGRYWVSHLSDALRFLALYKFGGYYFDLDVIHFKPVSPYKNFAALEHATYLGSSALHTDCHHPVIEMAVEEFRNSYRADIWGYNGPLLITRVLQNWCWSKKPSRMNYINCRGFNVLPETSFYSIVNSQWETLFEPVGNPHLALKRFGQKVLGVHVWNNLNAEEPIKKDSSQLYVHIAKERCPVIYSKAPQVF